MRILLVSQMYPGPADPDLGVFVQDLEAALAARGHEVARAVVDRRAGGIAKQGRLLATALAEARRFRPQVVYAHFLVPAGLAAAVAATRAQVPLVVTAHGQDVRNIGLLPGVATATRWVCRRATAVIAVSRYLRRQLEARVPEARGKTRVVGSGVDLERFRPQPAPAGPPSYLFLGSLTEQKNVLVLADAFQRLGEEGASLTLVGDGPLRTKLEGRPGVRLVGRVPHQEVPAWIAAARVLCLPSREEALGQALLEAMACGRPVVATRVGGPAEIVPPGAGVLVDPGDAEALVAALRQAARLPCPNPQARAAAEEHDLRKQAARVEDILVAAVEGAGRRPRAPRSR
jgi:glycosyltransferase involved in cell wall biosynthesis